MSEEPMDETDELDDFLDELPESDDVGSLLGVPVSEPFHGEDGFSDDSAEFDGIDDLLSDDFDDAGYGVQLEAARGGEFDPEEDGEFEDAFLDELPEDAALDELLSGTAASDLDPGEVDSVLELITDQTKLTNLISSLGARPGSAAARSLDAVEAAVEGPAVAVGLLSVSEFLPSVNWSGRAQHGANPAGTRAASDSPGGSPKIVPGIEW